MQFKTRKAVLKDGSEALLRSPSEADAEPMLDFLEAVTNETEFLMRSPNEPLFTVNREKEILRGILDSQFKLMLMCEVGGKIVGNCSLAFNNCAKTAHRASIAVSVRQKYWNRGIGTTLLCELERAARERGISQLELEFAEGNSRARALYEKMGFRIVGLHPNALKLSDGKLYGLYLMIKEL